MELVIFKWWNLAFKPDKRMDSSKDYMIHPEDLMVAYQLESKSDIFYIVDKQDDYTVINQLAIALQVKDNCLKLIIYEGFYLEDQVVVTSNNGQNTSQPRIIDSLNYHYKQNRLFYHLIDSNGKKLKKGTSQLI